MRIKHRYFLIEIKHFQQTLQQSTVLQTIKNKLNLLFDDFGLSLEIHMKYFNIKTGMIIIRVERYLLVGLIVYITYIYFYYLYITYIYYLYN